MKYLLDTDTCVFWIQKQRGVKAKAESFDAGDLAISVITVAELYFGVENSRKIEKNRRDTDALVMGLVKIELTVDMAKQYAKLRVHLKSRGTPVPDMDLLIASTALVYSLPLVTNNTRHYQNVPGLVLENWVS